MLIVSWPQIVLTECGLLLRFRLGTAYAVFLAPRARVAGGGQPHRSTVSDEVRIGLLVMTNQRHSWVEVDPGALQEALRQLAKLPKPLKRFRRSILSFGDGHVVLSDGLNELRVQGTGLWKVPALMKFPAFKVLRELAMRANPEQPLLIEGVDNVVRVGNSCFTCNFQKVELNVQGVMQSERERQRATEDNATIVGTGPVQEFDAAKTLHQIRELYPDSSSYGVIEFNLVTLPAFPHLVIYVRPACVEFRIVTDLAGSPTDWRTPSEIWKRLDHAIVRELGLGALIQWAGEAAAQKAEELRLQRGAP